MRVLSWNLYHGRGFPPGQRSLLDQFATLLNRLEWDVALLQEAPPRWFGELQRRTDSTGARVLTSRNSFGWLRGRLADWRPDLIKSQEGGSNQLLVRSGDGIAEHHAKLLARWPERRKLQWARLDSGVCVANLHASAGRPRKAAAEVLRAAGLAVGWSESLPLVFGGDLNVRPARDPEPFERLRQDFGLGDPTDPKAIDHLLARGLDVATAPRRLAPEERELPGADGGPIRLSDHAPVLAEFLR
jgi:endonuclease/exonuclease/phosphatase family metal-dependent hydrolase